jgi:D-amino-acid dehydrogenase
VPFEVLDRAGFCRVEPALKLTQEKFVGALRLPGDETGDCFLFTNRLAEMAAGLGVQFRWNTPSTALQAEGGRISGVRTSAGELKADAVVLALGSHSPQLLRPLGIRIPVYPVKGYSITVPITDASARPSRPSWTRRTRWPSRAWATASAWAARPSWRASAPRCANRAGARWSMW